MLAPAKPVGIPWSCTKVHQKRTRRLGVACSARPDSPYQSLERAVQVGGT